jgi:hypothetical protein
MKKLAVAAVTVLVAAAISVGVASGSGGGGTVIDEGFACGILDGNGNIFGTTNSELIYYSNQQGSKLVLRCSGYGAPAASLTYWNYGNTGFSCGVIYGSTTDWSDKVGRNGNSQLTCTLQLENGPDGAASGSAGIG